MCLPDFEREFIITLISLNIRIKRNVYFFMVFSHIKKPETKCLPHINFRVIITVHKYTWQKNTKSLHNFEENTKKMKSFHQPQYLSKKIEAKMKRRKAFIIKLKKRNFEANRTHIFMPTIKDYKDFNLFF